MKQTSSDIRKFYTTKTSQPHDQNSTVHMARIATN